LRTDSILGERTDRTAYAKQGFALLVTLSVLVIVIGLTGVLVGYLNDARQDASKSKALVQANLYYANLKQFLTKFKNRNTLYSILYTAPVPLVSEEGDFSLTLACRPLANGLDIRWLAKDNHKGMQSRYTVAQKVFDALAERYELADPTVLEEMIIAEIGGGERDGLQGHSSQKNGMISYSIFERILTQYEIETGDEHIKLVPWKKLFSFPLSSTDTKMGVLSGDYLSPELVSLLFDLDVPEVKEEWHEGNGALKHLSELYAIEYDRKLFSEKFVNASRCEVSYDYRKMHFMFGFNDIEGEVKDFEFYGKQ
jgi:type II secretory pathway pseudopilin PulG